MTAAALPVEARRGESGQRLIGPFRLWTTPIYFRSATDAARKLLMEAVVTVGGDAADRFMKTKSFRSDTIGITPVPGKRGPNAFRSPYSAHDIAL
jgi:hypothetical protein